MSEHKELIFSNDLYSGARGRAMAVLMNAMHKKVHAWLVKRIDTAGLVLDIGCGGGGLIATLLRRANVTVFGIDFSPDMVRRAQTRNQRAVQQHRAEIVVASVSALPYHDDTFDAAMAFETIQYWPDIVADLKEVLRVMKQKGVLYIMNRLPKPESKWYSRLPVKTAQDYADVLKKAGFGDVDIDTDSRKGWIVIKARQ